MVSKDEAKREVKRLIELYLKDKEKWQRIKETETRSKFIDPMLKALGWDFDSPEEVSMEVSISNESRKKRADYTFKLNGITRLIVEAKAIKENLSKMEYLEQTIGYAYNKSCSWAVLTDFEGVKIFFVDEERTTFRDIILSDITRFDTNFENLWLISRESILNNLIDKIAEDEGRKARKVKIDQKLFQDLNVWRELLYKDIKKQYTTEYKDEQIEEIVQKIIDRLIFIRKIEDMQTITEPILKALIRQNPPNIYKELKKIFRKFNEDCNSKLFGESYKDEHEADRIEISNNVIIKVIEGMYKPSERTVEYNFAVIDADILGNIYEKYLGYILKKRKIVEGQTHRKEQGIYYTPTYIVDYIVRNTIGEVLKDKNVNPESIKVLDPACGSGSFLLKAFDYLNDYWEKREGKTRQAKLDTEGIFTRKTHIMKNNIFGVDLDPKAVEIAQLNLLLKLAEKKHRLPTLRNNLKIGNSLVNDEGLSKKAFNWEREFQEIIEDGGFDVVIGNPPYINAIQLTKTVGEKVKSYWKEQYYSAKGTYDIYVLFFEQALKLCKKGGFVSFITPNKYLSSPYGVALREYIAKNYRLVKVVDLSKVRVFDDPSVYPIITIIQKIKPKKEYTIITEKILSENMNNKKVYHISSENLTTLPDYIWGIILSNNVTLIEKIFSVSKPLEEISIVQATSTASEADEYSKYIDENIKGIPIINTGTIDRYSTTYGMTKLMNKGKKMSKPVLDISKIGDKRRNLYKSPKIILSKLALRIEGFLDSNGNYASINTNCIHTPQKEYEIEYLCGVINSKLISFVYSELFSGLRMSGGYFQFQAPQIRILPIAPASKEKQNKISSLVKRMVSLSKEFNELGNKKLDENLKLEENIRRTDKEIDEIVYEIYGITKEEREIIEKNFE